MSKNGMTRAEFTAQHDPSPEVLRLRSYVKQLESENTRLNRQTGIDERLFQSVREEISAIAPARAVRYKAPVLNHDPLHPALIVTDVHAEELVLSEEMEGLAEYDWPICVGRMQATVQKTLELVNIQRQASVIDELHVWALGDWFNGKIQPQEEAWGNSMPFPKAVAKVSMQFAHMIASLAPHFKSVRVTGMCGNHGRDSKKTVFKATADRNWDMTVYLIAQEFCGNLNNVTWDIPNSIMHVTEIGGWKPLLTHSGEVNMNNRTPYYPIETTFDLEHKARSGTGKDFTHVFTGHWHHHAVLDSSIVMCPSMIGANQFSRFKLHRNSTPEQLLVFFTEKHGLIQQQPIKLIDAEPASDTAA